MAYTVADQIQTRGGRDHPDPEIREGRSPKKVFSTVRASFWSKNKGGPGPPRAPPLDPPLLYKGVPPGLYRIAFRADMKAEYPVQYERKQAFTHIKHRIPERLAERFVH